MSPRGGWTSNETSDANIRQRSARTKAKGIWTECNPTECQCERIKNHFNSQGKIDSHSYKWMKYAIWVKMLFWLIINLISWYGLLFMQDLETTFASKVATVSSESVVASFSTNPKESFVCYDPKVLLKHEATVKAIMLKLSENINALSLKTTLEINLSSKVFLPDEMRKKLVRIIEDASEHYFTMGKRNFITILNPIKYLISIRHF